MNHLDKTITPISKGVPIWFVITECVLNINIVITEASWNGNGSPQRTQRTLREKILLNLLGFYCSDCGIPQKCGMLQFGNKQDWTTGTTDFTDFTDKTLARL